MSDTIREQIISAFVTKAGELLTTNGYNTNAGNYVGRAETSLAATSLPAISIFPRVETSSKLYGKQVCVMPVEVKSMAIVSVAENASEVGEAILGDIITCLIGTECTRTFTSGGTYQVVVGNTITGATSGATAKVVGVTVSTGSWAAGNAAGTLRLRSQTGTFASENLNVGTNMNVATIAGNTTQIRAIDITGGGLADDIAYTGGGIEVYPETSETAVAVIASFDVTYATTIGNPYSQT